ncbi:uncharacterized protein LOC135090064 isoform X3 [Scylla paramamosain]|uniref:uncharacterized protein LOC135090064 isoform X3 n=1 Tax=Scylla paramamosain TaxID=85552 RepID=UPI003082F966
MVCLPAPLPLRTSKRECDWFMLQFLELEKKLYRQKSAVSVLEWYKSDPCRAPAHHLAYHFYKNLVPGSVTEQLMELECISRACPDNPMVLEQVNLYLHSLEHGGPALERAVMWMRSAESDSGQESSDECPGPTNASCTLRTTGKMEVLMRCLSLLVAMLDYPAHTWDLQRWQKLTQVLTKFYQAWVQTDGSAASAQLPSAKTAAPPADAKMSTLMVDNDEAANQLLKKKLEIELKLMEN